MKITMYELLGMIRDCKAPKKIKVYGKVYINNGCNCYLDENDRSLCNNVEIPMYLYDEVEIIEEPQEHKIPEKFKVHSLGDKDKYGNYVDSPFPTNKELMNKINEIIDYLEKIK